MFLEEGILNPKTKILGDKNEVWLRTNGAIF